MTTFDDPTEFEFDARCPACGNPIQYCQGHGEMGDPTGFKILIKHDDGFHDQCHPEGCDSK